MAADPTLPSDIIPAPRIAYTLPDLSCLQNVPEIFRKEIMKHLVPNSPSCLVTCACCPCYFLEKIPIEIRDTIYGYLLTNPILGKASCIDFEDSEYLDSYDLTPSIIATCKQISQEASRVLYGNTFHMGIAGLDQDLGNWGGWEPRLQLLSPLTRYQESVSHLAISRVCKWKIIFVGRVCQPGITDLTKFCLAVSASPVKSLELLLNPWQERSVWERPVRFQSILQPLRLLRNIEQFNYRVADVPDIPLGFLSGRIQQFDSQHAPEFDEGQSALETETELLEFQSVVQGNRPVELLPQMFNSLLRYVMAFDCCGNFDTKLERKLIWCRQESSLPLFSPDELYKCYCQLVRLYDYHPNGKYLLEAESQIELQDMSIFKNSRARVFDALETQYQQIVSAALRMAEFVKGEKRSDGIFHMCEVTNGRLSLGPVPTAALVLFEDYVTAFKSRAIPSEVREKVMDHRHCSHNHRSLWRSSDDVFQKPSSSFREIKAFKTGLDELNTHYLNIRKVRKKLYEVSCLTFEAIISVSSWFRPFTAFQVLSLTFTYGNFTEYFCLNFKGSTLTSYSSGTLLERPRRPFKMKKLLLSAMRWLTGPAMNRISDQRLQMAV